MAELSARDKRLAALFESFPAEARDPPRDLFANLCRTISSQLLSTAAAGAIFGRVTTLCDGAPNPSVLAEISDSDLRGAGLSFSKIATMRALAEVFQGEDNPFANLKDADDSA